MKTKITKRSVEAAPIPSTTKKDSWLWDTELPGFGCRITHLGSRIYTLQSRIHGRLRKIRLGKHGVTSAGEARRQALVFLADITRGADPTTERRARKTQPNIAEFMKRYIREHAEPHKKPRSVEEDRRNLRLHVLPILGQRKLCDIARADIAVLHHRMHGTPVTANRVLALLSTMFNLAERWGIRPDGTNPCRHIRKYKERARKRFLSKLELKRLGRVLSEAERVRTEPQGAIAAIRLLILTGARKAEILTLRWDYIDMIRGEIRLPDSKTGAKSLPLIGPAREVIESLSRDGSPWVIRGAKPGSHLVNLQTPWRAIRQRAGINDVRLHDLRHSFASVAVEANLGLPVVGALLGHRDAATTNRYAHLAIQPLAKASRQIQDEIADAMKEDPIRGKLAVMPGLTPPLAKANG